MWTGQVAVASLITWFWSVVLAHYSSLEIYTFYIYKSLYGVNQSNSTELLGLHRGTGEKSVNSTVLILFAEVNIFFPPLTGHTPNLIHQEIGILPNVHKICPNRKRVWFDGNAPSLMEWTDATFKSRMAVMI